MKNIKKDFYIENIVFHLWLDHLEIYWTFKYEKEFFNKLDFDNSNYSEFEEYTITKNEVNRYKYKIIFTKDNYTLFAYYKWIKKWEWVNISTKDYICIYSTAFKLMEYEEILAFLQLYFNLRHCRRFDICIDLKININDLLKYFKEEKTWRIYKNAWNIETKYFWEVKNSRNKRQLIRVYNKYRDIIEKKKLKLYSDYLNIWDITRVELEIRTELAKNINYINLFDDILLLWVFKNYLSKHTELFDFIAFEKITLYKKKEINLDDFQWIFYIEKRYQNFVWYAKNLFNLWFCPVRVLINEWYIQDITKKIIWYENINEIIKKEKRIIEDVKEKIENKKFEANGYKKILDNLYKYGKI